MSGITEGDLEQYLRWLPTEQPDRWTPRRKAAIVAAVLLGRLTRAQARARYGISEEELLSWQRGLERYGNHKSLRATRLKCYRQ